MSIVIAYLLIGALMGIGLISDRWNRICFSRDSISDWSVIVIVFLIAVVCWPTFFTAANMEADDE